MKNDLLLLLVDFLFPSKCIFCNKSISYNQNCLCNDCYKNVELLVGQCEICSGILIENQCVICANKKFYIDKNITVSEYSGIMKEILHNFKFNKKKRLFFHLSELALKKVITFQDYFDIITCVPMNRKKIIDRGFNQSELIARQLAKELNKNYYSLLCEKYFYKTQRNLGFRDRFLNILERYKVKNPNRFKGLNILLIDDVFTTGATINECARILKTFGANKVYSLTIARANIKILEKF